MTAAKTPGWCRGCGRKWWWLVHPPTLSPCGMRAVDLKASPTLRLVARRQAGRPPHLGLADAPRRASRRIHRHPLRSHERRRPADRRRRPVRHEGRGDSLRRHLCRAQGSTPPRLLASPPAIGSPFSPAATSRSTSARPSAPTTVPTSTSPTPGSAPATRTARRAFAPPHVSRPAMSATPGSTICSALLSVQDDARGRRVRRVLNLTCQVFAALLSAADLPK